MSEMLEFENASALDIALSEKVSGLLEASIETQGSASLVVSGGRTPMGFFHLLSQHVLDWSKVTVLLADERWVDADHADSNEKLVRENLLINEASQANYLALKTVRISCRREADAHSAGWAGCFYVVIWVWVMMVTRHPCSPVPMHWLLVWIWIPVATVLRLRHFMPPTSV